MRQAFDLFESEGQEGEELPVQEDLAEESCDVHAEVMRGCVLVCVDCGVLSSELTVAG